MTTENLPYGIDGITDVMYLQRAGRIRTGAKVVTKGKEHPEKWDCFNFVDAENAARFHAEQAGIPLTNAEGKPVSLEAISKQLNIRELNFLFPIDDKRAVLDQAYMRYGGSGAWSCRGNGISAWDREAKDEVDCQGEDCELYRKKQCRRQSRLSVVLFEVSGGLTIHDVTSTGRQSAKNLSGGIDMLKRRFGRIDNIPLKLYLRPYKTFYYGADGSPRKTIPFALMIDIDASLLDIEMLKRRAGRAIMPAPLEQLPEEMYPKSLQEEMALPPASDFPDTPIVVNPEPPPAEEPEIIPAVPDIDPRILEGFNLLGVPEDQMKQLLDRYQDDPEKLFQYLSARVDAEVEGKQEPPQEPRPVQPPAQKPTGTNGKSFF